MGETIWKTVYDKLVYNGFLVYPPATHVGECKERYIVLKSDGSSQFGQFSTERHYYTLLLYVPQSEYTDLEAFKNSVKEVMNSEVFPLLVPTGQETPDYFDDSNNAHMTSVQYRNNVRNEKL